MGWKGLQRGVNALSIFDISMSSEHWQVPTTQNYPVKVSIVSHLEILLYGVRIRNVHIMSVLELEDTLKSRAGIPNHFSILLCPQRRYNLRHWIIVLIQVFFHLCFKHV